MKLLLSLEEVKQAVVQFVKTKQSVQVDTRAVTIRTGVNGEFDDRELYLEGVEVELPPDKEKTK